MSNEAASPTLPRTVARRLLALVTLVALFVTFSSVRVADADDPSLDDVAATLDSAGLLASSGDDASTTSPDDVLVGEPDAPTGASASGADASAEPTATSPTDTTMPDTQESVETSAPLAAADAGLQTQAVEELSVSNIPIDEPADEIYTEEDAAAEEAAIYTEEDAAKELSAVVAVHTDSPIPIHTNSTATSSADDDVAAQGTAGEQIDVVLGEATTDDAGSTDGTSDEAPVTASEPITDDESSDGESAGVTPTDDDLSAASHFAAGVDSNDYLADANGDPILGAASVRGPLLLVEADVTNGVSTAINQVLPRRFGIAVERPTPSIEVEQAEANEPVRQIFETPQIQGEELFIDGASIPGPPVEDALLESAASTTPTTTAPVIPAPTTTQAPTTTTAPTTTVTPRLPAPTTIQAPPTTVRQARPAPARPAATAAPAPVTTAPPTSTVPTTVAPAAPTTVSEASPTTAAPTTTAPEPTTTTTVELEVEDVAAEAAEELTTPEVAVVKSGERESALVFTDEAPTADEEALEIAPFPGAFEFRGNAARLGAVWALWVLGTVAIMALWLPIPSLRRSTGSSLPRRRS